MARLVKRDDEMWSRSARKGNSGKETKAIPLSISFTKMEEHYTNIRLERLSPSATYHPHFINRRGKVPTNSHKYHHLFLNDFQLIPHLQSQKREREKVDNDNDSQILFSSCFFIRILCVQTRSGKNKSPILSKGGRGPTSPISMPTNIVAWSFGQWKKLHIYISICKYIEGTIENLRIRIYRNT